MKQRDQVAMTAEETAAMLAGSAKLQLATINPDGTAHLVTMFYAMLDGQIAFWTYRSSQKARNIARDPRVTCLVEAGEEYFDLRGVQIAGGSVRLGDVDVVKLDQAELARVRGRLISYVPQDPGGALNPSLRVGARAEALPPRVRRSSKVDRATTRSSPRRFSPQRAGAGARAPSHSASSLRPSGLAQPE